MLNVNWCRGCFKNAVSSWTVCLTAQHLAQQKESRTTTFSVYHCAISCRALSACVCIVHHHEPLQCSDQIWGILMASSPQMQDKAPVNRAKIQSQLQQTIECCTFICNDGENNDPLNMNCSFWFPLQCLQPFQRHVLASGYCQFGFGVRFYGYIYNTMWLSSGRKNANSLKTRYSCQMCPSAVPLSTQQTLHTVNILMKATVRLRRLETTEYFADCYSIFATCEEWKLQFRK